MLSTAFISQCRLEKNIWLVNTAESRVSPKVGVFFGASLEHIFCKIEADLIHNPVIYLEEV
jgi:hypothetical protein